MIVALSLRGVCGLVQGAIPGAGAPSGAGYVQPLQQILRVNVIPLFANASAPPMGNDSSAGALGAQVGLGYAPEVLRGGVNDTRAEKPPVLIRAGKEHS